MILSVSDQVVVFLWTTACGVAVAFIFDLFRIFRKAVKTGSLVTSVQDVLYWIIACIIMFLTIYYSNDGEIRGFLFLGAFLGAVLYALMFSHIIMSSSLFIIGMTIKVIKYTCIVVSYPFRMIIKLLAIPARKLGMFAAAEFRRSIEKRRAMLKEAQDRRKAKAGLKKKKPGYIRGILAKIKRKK